MLAQPHQCSLKLYFYFASLLHICFVITPMIMTSRMIEINSLIHGYKFNITGGMFLIPISFFIQDIITEIYGYYNARKLLYSTLLVYVFFIIILCLFFFLFPCESKEKICNDLYSIIKTLPRHAASFIFSLAMGGMANIYILNKSKLLFNGNFLALRFISSTAIGELIFQIIAVSISWLGNYAIIDILPLALISYAYKILFEIISMPINIYICRYLNFVKLKEKNYVF